MTDSNRESEPAYPTLNQVERSSCIDKADTVTARGGLTKLEHFAGLAMQGLLERPDIKRDPNYKGGFYLEFYKHDRVPSKDTVSVLAVDAAKALIAELEKSND